MVAVQSPTGGLIRLLPNRQGSVIGWLRPDGKLGGAYTYDAYGNSPQAGAAGPQFRYAGMRLDAETGLYHTPFRAYDPVDGRWMQLDPIGIKDGLNRYAYVKNSPLMGVDPTGLYVETAWDLVSLGIGVASAKDNWSEGNYLAFTVDAVGVVADAVAIAVPGVPGGAGAGIKAIRGAEKGVEATKATAKTSEGAKSFYRGSKSGAEPSFKPRTGEFKVDKETGFVRPERGVSVFDNPDSVASKGFVPNEVDMNSAPESLQIKQVGQDLHHYEIMPRPDARLTPEEFVDACSKISCK